MYLAQDNSSGDINDEGDTLAEDNWNIDDGDYAIQDQLLLDQYHSHCEAGNEDDSVTKCDYQETQMGDLRRYIQSQHQHECLKYYCNQCKYQGKQKEDLQKHIQHKHEGVKYSCVQCDYQGGHNEQTFD